jgi:methylthioribose-1-phosphate isomerase
VDDGSGLPNSVEWVAGSIRLLDQRTLPGTVTYLDITTVGGLCDAIESLAVRGAPALGAAGAFGVAMVASQFGDQASVRSEAERIASARPTAVNLRWGVDIALAAYERGGGHAALAAAQQLAAADIAANRAIGEHGLAVIPRREGGARVLTHCNAGHLATVGYGTAIGIVRAGFDAGLVAHVYVDETRPLLQGARLTAWECRALGIPATLIIDSAAGSHMARGLVDMVVVGADRIAANGDVANKIGTYSLAVLARYHHVPFVVAAPMSTVDAATASGADIEIEDRPGDEVRGVGSAATAPEAMTVSNPAFDVTPADLVTTIVTELGAFTPNELARHLVS